MLCDICNKQEAAIYMTGLGNYCLDCNNSRVSSIYGIDYLKQYAREVVIHDSQNRPHTFSISNILSPMFSHWIAEERDPGYRFTVLTKPDADQIAALLKLHRKIYAGLQQQTLKRSESTQVLLNAMQCDDGQYFLRETGYGRIDYDTVANRPCLIMDGRIVSGEDFVQMLSVFEGFNLLFQVQDPSDDILEDDSVLVPHRIDADTIFEKVEETLSWFLDNHAFLSYKREPDCSSALFRCWDEFELLCRHGKPEIARYVGKTLMARLLKIEHDTDAFPEYHIHMINTIMDQYLAGAKV